MGLEFERRLTLISAPAGFGKTTLLAEWLATSRHIDRRTVWVSLDQNDNDPVRFWTYLFTSLREIHPEIGTHALSLLQSSQPPPVESILTNLVNHIGAFQEKVTLILDDYHVIDSQPIHSAIAFLLDHLPPQMDIVIASRSDPPLPLARLRGRGELTEIRASDLRFTPDEAVTFFNDMMRLGLSADDVDTLETRTEGWIVGLQLAALSMQGREDTASFIRAFAGDDRFIVDYLLDEVLERQPDQIREFLLQTSILEQLSGPLCDAVTGGEDGKTVLATLERGNLFVVPLDDKRNWYRYHHLFADVLQVHAFADAPDQVTIRHRRASQWYEEHGRVPDAIRHGLAAGDYARAAGLIERTWPAMDLSRQSATWLAWVRALPEEHIVVRPVLNLAYARALLNTGELEAGEARLQVAERRLEPAPEQPDRENFQTVEMVVTDDEEMRYLPASIAAARAYHALALDDVSGTIKYARQALDHLPEDESLRRGSPAALLALASWTNGDLEMADHALAEAMENAQSAGNVIFVITGTFVLAEIRKTRGRLQAALHACQRSLRLAASHDDAVIRTTADIYTGLTDLHREWNLFDSAEQYLSKSKELGEQATLPHWRHRWYLAKARLLESEGDFRGALDNFEEAEQQFVRGPVPDALPIAALKIRVLLTLGRMSEAIDWIRERDLSTDGDLSYLREFEYLTLARVLIAQYQHDRKTNAIFEALGLLDRVLTAASTGGRTGTIISILVLQALANEAIGDEEAALRALERATTVAEPEGYERVFIDEGEPMRRLLRQLPATEIADSYPQRLLSAFGEFGVTYSSPVHLPVDGLVEPLTVREDEILRLIASGLTNKGIAEQLYISLPTVKRHISNIYGKLGVGHRTEALARAAELNLL